MSAKLHPELQTLLSKNKGSPTPLAVLNELLNTNKVTLEAIQEAYQRLEHAIQTTKDSEKKPPSDKKQCSKQYRYRHVALRVYYDGADYTGLAHNIGREEDNSIERSLFQALQKTKLVESRDSSGYSRCGRTDKGVSAAGQVVALMLKSNIQVDATMEDGSSIDATVLPKNAVESIRVQVPPKKGNGAANITKDVKEYPYEKMLNNVLPENIRVIGWCPVSPDFSARFSATTRTYRYFFIPRQLNLDNMRQGLALLKGKHDFRNFCKMDVEKVYNFERQIHSAELVEEPSSGVCYFQIIGQAFLWHQIRCIVSLLFMVGRGLEDVSVISELLDVEKHPGKPSYPLASEYPLVLHECGYNDLQLGHSCQNLWALSCRMEQQWEDLTIAAARVRNCLENVKEGSTVMRQDVVDFLSNKLQERIKKQNNHNGGNSTTVDLKQIDETLPSSPTLTWGQALQWMAGWDCVPCPNSGREIAHTPLLQRSKGTTYEEKLEALSKSKRRQQRYEENVIKKRKTKDEDSAFYNHMTKQGGTGISS